MRDKFIITQGVFLYMSCTRDQDYGQDYHVTMLWLGNYI